MRHGPLPAPSRRSAVHSKFTIAARTGSARSSACGVGAFIAASAKQLIIKGETAIERGTCCQLAETDLLAGGRDATLAHSGVDPQQIEVEGGEIHARNSAHIIMQFQFTSALGYRGPAVRATSFNRTSAQSKCHMQDIQEAQHLWFLDTWVTIGRASTDGPRRRPHPRTSPSIWLPSVRARPL
jgi:hypothetical protein